MKTSKMYKYCPGILLIVALLLIMPGMLATGPFIVGSDSHVELFFAQKALDTGWDTSIPIQANTCLGLNVITPFLSRLLHIEPAYILKVIFPLIFCCVPVVLYFVWSRYMKPLEAFLAAIFWMIIPTTLMEVSVISKQSFAEIWLALFILISLSKLKLPVKIPSLILTGALTIMCHYSLGFVLLMYMLLYTVIMFFFKRHWQNAVVFVALFAVTVFYHGGLAQGITFKSFTDMLPFSSIAKIGNINIGYSDQKTLTYLSQDGNQGESNNILPQAVVQTGDSTLKAGLGLDFMSVSLLGKAFRIIQWITQLLLVIGFGYFLFKSRKLGFSSEYFAFSLVSVLILLLCLVVPGFSGILNMSRWYHITLFFLAPMLVIGMKWACGGYGGSKEY